MKTRLAILMALVTSACLAEAPSRAAEEVDIREAIFRYQFAKTNPRSVSYYYLALSNGQKESDPDGAFLKRFAGNVPPVKKVSECDSSAQKGVWDKKSGERGIIFRTGSIRWLSETEVEVTGGYYAGGRSASGSVYRLEKTKGEWKVVKEVVRWIS